MDAETLQSEAAPYFTRQDKARAAFKRMADTMGGYEARDALHDLYDARDLVTEVTAVNWWADYHNAHATDE